MHLFGLTGGLASGKSTVAARFAARGVPVIDADQVAREVVLPGTPGLLRLREALGAEVVLADGSLDRKRVAALVFADDAKRRALNATLHPLIAARTAERAAELGARGEPLACYEAALLVENGLVEAFRPLVGVLAPEDARIARATARDGSTADAARARIRTQAPAAELERLADVVIRNDGDKAALERAADAALAAVCARVGVPLERYALPTARSPER